MSANNQTLVKEHKGRFWIFANVNAESWGWNEKENEPASNKLHIREASAVCDTKEEALKKAFEIDKDDYLGGTEYGVRENKLYKDNAEVEIID